MDYESIFRRDTPRLPENRSVTGIQGFIVKIRIRRGCAPQGEHFGGETMGVVDAVPDAPATQAAEDE